MITIRLVNMPSTSHSYLVWGVVRIVKISLSDCKEHSTGLLTVATMPHVMSQDSLVLRLYVCTLWAPSPIFPSQPLATTNLFCFHISGFGFVFSTYRWEHTVVVILRLTYVTHPGWTGTLGMTPEAPCPALIFYGSCVLWHVVCGHRLLVGISESLPPSLCYLPEAVACIRPRKTWNQGQLLPIPPA